MLSTDIAAKHTDGIAPAHTDEFKRLFATAFVANNFNFLATKQQLSDGDVKFSRLSMVSDPDTSRYIREELAKRRDQYFFTAEDIAAGMYAIAADPNNTPEQRFPYYKVLAEATGLIGRGKQVAQDVSPSSGVVIQIANYGSDGVRGDGTDVSKYTDVTKPTIKSASSGTPVITGGKASGKRLTPTDAELDDLALSPDALAGIGK